MKENAYSLILDGTPWGVFLTGTLRGESTSLKSISKSWEEYWNQVAKMFGNRTRNQKSYGAYFVRFERGELGSRWHLHALIALPNRKTTKKLRFALKALWEQIPRNGMARTRSVFNSSDDFGGSRSALAHYLTKLEENRYEGGKFPGAEMFLISPALLPDNEQPNTPYSR